MDLTFLLPIFIFGAVIGSFLNVVILRYNTGLSSTRGRSKCFVCNTKLKWYELLPVVSFICLRGKCRTCHSSISVQYILVEILTGVLFIGLLLRQVYVWPLYASYPHALLYSVLFFIFYAVVFGVLIVISVYDMRHKIIPDGLVYTFIVLSVIKLAIFFFCRGFTGGELDYLNAFSPILIATPFALLWLFSNGAWIGFGDVKLVFGIGALLGFVYGVSAIVLGFWTGALWGIWLILRNKIAGKKIGIKSEVPFAPFLILGTLIVFFTHVDVLGLGQFFNLLF